MTWQRISTQRNLFLSLLALLLVSPLFDAFAGSRLLLYASFGLVLITGPTTVASSRADLWFSLTAGGLMLAPGVLGAAMDSATAIGISSAIGCVFFTHAAYVLTRSLLFRVSTVSNETLWAAVNVYLVIGLAFAFLYASIALIDGDAFVGNFMGEDLLRQVEGFIYFSFVSMTTVGYGDLAPNLPFVATIAYLQAVLGQLYVAIKIARLVGLHIAGDNDRADTEKRAM